MYELESGPRTQYKHTQHHQSLPPPPLINLPLHSGPLCQITKGNQASGAGTPDADRGANTKTVMDRKAMEIADV